MYIKLNDENKIIGVSSVAGKDWVETDKEYVYSYAQNRFVLAEEIDEQEEKEAFAILNTPPPPTIDELKQGLINAVQTYMDTTAQTRGYDSIASACSYGLSTVQKFREEAVACISWRDNVWNYCYEQLALFESGERDVPTVEQLIAELPTLEW